MRSVSKIEIFKSVDFSVGAGDTYYLSKVINKMFKLRVYVNLSHNSYFMLYVTRNSYLNLFGHSLPVVQRSLVITGSSLRVVRRQGAAKTFA